MGHSNVPRPNVLLAYSGVRVVKLCLALLFGLRLSYVYTLRLIGPISYPDECDLMVHPRKYIVIFSRMHFVTFVRI